MAKSTPVKKAWRSLTWLGVLIIALVGLNAIGAFTGGGSWAPKLALDLQGGTQIILAPKLESGKTVSQEQLDQAVSIIRQRIDSAGVSESEINTQGGQNIVVSIPGTPDDETINRIEASAKLEFRPVLVAGQPADAVPDGGPGTAEHPHHEADQRERPRLCHSRAAGEVRRVRLQEVRHVDRAAGEPAPRDM